MAKRNTEEQMKLFEEGGLKDEGGSVDPVSGNDVPSGSTQAEVRDDIPAQLSEGEFVFPADVVRYIGLENLMQLRSKAKQGLAKMEAMGQMGNSEDATMSDDVEFESEIDALIENFDPNDPSTMEFSQGGVVKAANGFFAQPQQSSYGYMPPGFGTQQQVPASGLSYRSPQIPMAQPFVTSAGQSAGASVGTGTGMQDNIEQRQYIGPNGELITIMFKNGVPQQKVPEGYKVYKPEEVKPEVAAPVVQQPTGGDGGDGPQDPGKTAIDIGRELTGKVDDPALQKAQDDLSAFGLKTFGMTLAGLAVGPGAAFGIAKSREEEYNQLRNNYFKEVSRVAATQNPDKYKADGLYSRLTNPTTKVLDVAKEGTPGGFTDQTRNKYVDMDGLVRDTSRLSDDVKDSLELESKTPSVTPFVEDVVTDAEVRAAEQRARETQLANQAKQDAFDRAADLASDLGFEDRSSDNQDYGGGSGDATQSDSASFGGDEGWD